MIRPTLLAIFAWIAVAAQAGETIRLRADEWMPYNGVPSSKTPGYTIEILRAVFGADLDYGTMPWAEARKEVATGVIEAIVGCNQTEALGLVVPNECIGRADTALYVRADSTLSYSSLLSLKDAKLGAIKDYSYWDTLDAMIAKGGPNLTLFEGSDALSDAIHALADGTVEVVPENRYVFTWKLKSMGIPTSRYRTLFVYSGEKIFIAFSPAAVASRTWAAKFDRELRAMRKDGRLAAILAKYGMSDWEN